MTILQTRDERALPGEAKNSHLLSGEAYKEVRSAHLALAGVEECSGEMRGVSVPGGRTGAFGKLSTGASWN